MIIFIAREQTLHYNLENKQPATYAHKMAVHTLSREPPYAPTLQEVGTDSLPLLTSGSVTQEEFSTCSSRR
ncbi:hypothetical protein ACHAXM_007523 [Skeletonema potamos]